MTIEQRIQQGDFEGTLALVYKQRAGPRPDPDDCHLKVITPSGGMSMVGIWQVRRIEFDVQAKAAGAENPKRFWKRLLS